MLPPVVTEFEERVRAGAFAYLGELALRSGSLIRWQQLMEFSFEGARFPLVSSARGIWVPRGFGAALSILTVYRARPEDRPYDDREGPDGYPRYKWQGTDPRARDNVALRRAMEAGIPVIWLLGVATGLYDVAPVWLVDEEPEEHQFVLAMDELMRLEWRRGLAAKTPFDPVRRYAEVTVHARLHQRVFRGRVLVAYDSQCALCGLRHHPELLDAAHIKEDADGGEPIVPNGLAMCAIHHRAFDAHLMAVRPDYHIEVRGEVLDEQDGPTLRHALQGIHGGRIRLPRRRAERPSVELLEERYERFRAAG
jgi:putative restriction endonuclease